MIRRQDGSEAVVEPQGVREGEGKGEADAELRYVFNLSFSCSSLSKLWRVLLSSSRDTVMTWLVTG